jgi:hypothetical protein
MSHTNYASGLSNYPGTNQVIDELNRIRNYFARLLFFQQQLFDMCGMVWLVIQV